MDRGGGFCDSICDRDVFSSKRFYFVDCVLNVADKIIDSVCRSSKLILAYNFDALCQISIAINKRADTDAQLIYGLNDLFFEKCIDDKNKEKKDRAKRDKKDVFCRLNFRVIIIKRDDEIHNPKDVSLFSVRVTCKAVCFGFHRVEKLDGVVILLFFLDVFWLFCCKNFRDDRIGGEVFASIWVEIKNEL